MNKVAKKKTKASASTLATAGGMKEWLARQGAESEWGNLARDEFVRQGKR